jgi:acetyl esterase/lipase
VDAARIGAMGWSAGGWAVTQASALAARPGRTPLGFLVLLVGPATSVARQQIGSNAAAAHMIGLSPADSADAVRYMEVAVGGGDRARRFAELRRLLANGERAGWARAFLEADDIPRSAAGVDSLWAVRNAYDPAAALRAFRGPLLALYGGADPVVPAEENAALLRRLAGEGGNARVRAVVVPEANHGLEQRAGRRVPPGGAETDAYWKFGRPAPQLAEELLAFLRAHGLAAAPR